MRTSDHPHGIVTQAPATHGVECYEAWRQFDSCPHENTPVATDLTMTRVDQGEQRARYHVTTPDGAHVATVHARYAGGFTLITTRHGPGVGGHVDSLDVAASRVAAALTREAAW